MAGPPNKRQKREEYRRTQEAASAAAAAAASARSTADGDGGAETGEVEAGVQKLALPKKKFYRQRAHANPFSDHMLT